MATQTDNLPVYAVLDELKSTLKNQNFAVLAAEPGAGKSTVIPTELLQAPFLSGKKIIVLEPRRLAAKMVANYVNELSGNQAGFRVRGENSIRPATRIEFVTEGIFTRMIQNDMELESVGMVIFDEFHERNLNSDLGLALARDVQKSLRSDLRILIMSASLNLDELTKRFPEIPVIHCCGRTFPLEIVYADYRISYPDCVKNAFRTILHAAYHDDGNILVFLPGQSEILKLSSLLKNQPDLADFAVLPLYGAMNSAAQNAVVTPSTGRKIILATNIAESSVTIENIKVVIDSGLEKSLIYDVGTDLSCLTVKNIAKSSAIQRAGRAGRTSNGKVYRLYSKFAYESLENFNPPEIVNSELSNLLLECKLFGVNPLQLDFVTPPPSANLSEAENLLKNLSALDPAGRITASGRKMAGLPLQTRLSYMLLKGFDLQIPSLACELAALLETPAKFLNHIDLCENLRRMRQQKVPQYQEILTQLLKINQLKYQEHSMDKVPLLLALAFPEHVAKQRSFQSREYQLASRRSAVLPPENDNLSNHDAIVAARTEKRDGSGKIQLAAAADLTEICNFMPHLVHRETLVEYDESSDKIKAKTITFFLEMPINETLENQINPQRLKTKLIEIIRAKGLKVFELSNSTCKLLDRMNFARHFEPETFPDFSEAAILSNLDNFLDGYWEKIHRISDLKKLDFHQILTNHIDYNLKQKLDRLYPEKFTTNSNNKITLQYRENEVVLSVKIHELYGIKTHPAVGSKKLPLKIELLSPAMRVVQITGDLPRFWSENWRLVQRDMKQRYIKHYWPDDPANAPPQRSKPKS